MQQKSRPELSTKETIRDALLAIVVNRGIDHVSVREVAAGAGVSIGTVQHHFATKDAMLLDAYTTVVEGIRQRIATLRYGASVVENVGMVVEELLPLDFRRKSEVRLHVAFAARAMNAPALADVERDLLAGIHDELAGVLAAAMPGSVGSDYTAAARAVLALTDGLAGHAVSSGDLFAPDELLATVRYAVTALIGSVPSGPSSGPR